MDRMALAAGDRATGSAYDGSDQALIDCAVIGIARVTDEGRFVSANPALLRMLGVPTREDLASARLAAFFVDAGRYEALMRTVAIEGRAVSGNVEWSAPGANRITVRLTAVRDVTSRGAGTPIGLFVEDVSAYRTLEEKLQLSQKLEHVGRLVGGVAHDFANILTAILGYSEKMLDEIGTDKPLSGDLLEIRKAADRARALIRQLLAFTRTDQRRRTLVDVNHIVRDTQGMLRQLVGAKVGIVLGLAPDLPPILADRVQIEQVLLNLAVNARDAMDGKGELTIETGSVDATDASATTTIAMEPGRYVRLLVRDTGSGMDAATQARIFDPFFTTKAPGHGTGLGLATVYGIAKDLCGYIAVSSRLDHGTTFTVFLPEANVVVGTAKSETSPAASSRPLTHGDEVILLVEDDPEVRKMAGVTLRRHGYTVLEAGFPLDGLRLATHIPGPIHLVLSDVIMPGLNGPEFMERLRSTRPQTKVLYMTGYANGSRIAANAGRVLEKPFTPDMLLSEVRRCLNDAADSPGDSNPTSTPASA